MAREMQEHRTIVFVFEETGLAPALREAADLLDERPEEYDTKGAYIVWVDGQHHVVLPLSGRRPRL